MEVNRPRRNARTMTNQPQQPNSEDKTQLPGPADLTTTLYYRQILAATADLVVARDKKCLFRSYAFYRRGDLHRLGFAHGTDWTTR